MHLATLGFPLILLQDTVTGGYCAVCSGLVCVLFCSSFLIFISST